MSDNISQGMFDVIWDDLINIINEDDIKQSENEVHEVVSVVFEISFEEFEMKGFDARILDTNMTDIDSEKNLVTNCY